MKLNVPRCIAQKCWKWFEQTAKTKQEHYARESRIAEIFSTLRHLRLSGQRQTMYVTYEIKGLNMAALLLVSSDFTLYWHSLSSRSSGEISFLPQRSSCSPLLSSICLFQWILLFFQTLIVAFEYKETAFEVRGARLTETDCFIGFFFRLHFEDIFFCIM